MEESAAGMEGRICVVTGASSGIGLETSIGLARLGATIVIVCRDEKRGGEALVRIRSVSGREDVVLMVCDISSQKSIRDFVVKFKARFCRLDVLVNNAGVLLKNRSVTVDGLETTFATNHLGYFMLSLLLLDTLAKSQSPRIVNVASAIQYPMDFDDLQSERNYDMIRAYGASKMGNVLFTYELARRLKGTKFTVNCLHPGVVATNISKNTGRNLFFRALFGVLRAFYLTPKQGAATPILLASSPDVGGISGKYYVGGRQTRSSKESYDVRSGERLWAISEHVTGLNAQQIISNAIKCSRDGDRGT